MSNNTNLHTGTFADNQIHIKGFQVSSLWNIKKFMVDAKEITAKTGN